MNWWIDSWIRQRIFVFVDMLSLMNNGSKWITIFWFITISNFDQCWGKLKLKFDKKEKQKWTHLPILTFSSWLTLSFSLAAMPLGLPFTEILMLSPASASFSLPLVHFRATHRMIWPTSCTMAEGKRDLFGEVESPRSYPFWRVLRGVSLLTLQ